MRADSGPELSIVIVNYNGASYLPGTLQAVAEIYPRAECILVDNDSSDDSITLTRLHFPEVFIMARMANDGPGPARNYGLKHCRSRYALIIDNDVAPMPGCVEELVRALDVFPKSCVAVPAVMYEHEPTRVQFAGANAHFLGTVAAIGNNLSVEELPNKLYSCSSLISSALLVDRERLGEHILFNESLFIYQEDHEAGLRLASTGKTLVCNPKSLCIHREGTIGLSVRQTGKYVPRRIQQTIYNRWYILITIYQKRTLIRFLPALLYYELAQLTGALALGWGAHWLWAARRLLGNLKPTLDRRAANRKVRRVPDAQLLSGGPFPFNTELKQSFPRRAAQATIDAVCKVNWAIARPRRQR